MFLSWSKKAGLTKENSPLSFGLQPLCSSHDIDTSVLDTLTTTVTRSNQRPPEVTFCSLSLLFTICCQTASSPPVPPAHQLRQKKSQRSDPPGGKRWRRSTCSPSAHCPLQLPGPWKQITGLIFNSSFLLALLVRPLPSQQLPGSLSIQQCTDQWSYALCIATGQPHIHHLQWVIKFSSTTQTNQAKLITKSLYWFSPFFLFLKTTRKYSSQNRTNPSLALHLMGDHDLFEKMQ